MRRVGSISGAIKGTLVEKSYHKTLESDIIINVNAQNVSYSRGSAIEVFIARFGDVTIEIDDIDFCIVGDSVNYVHNQRGYNNLEISKFVPIGLNDLFNFETYMGNIAPPSCYITLEQIAERSYNNPNNEGDSNDDDDDDDTQPENQEDVFVPSLFWSYFLSKNFADGEIILNDFNDKLSDVYNDFNFVDGFVDVLNDFQVYFNKQTKQYGFIISENFDVQKIQSNDYFALQNILLFESVVYNGISEKTNFVYATTKYILKNLGQRMFFCDNERDAEDFKMMVYLNDDGQIVFTKRFENRVINEFEELYSEQLTMLARLRRFFDFEKEKPYLFLNFKQNTLRKIKPNIYYAKKFEDYCKGLSI